MTGFQEVDTAKHIYRAAVPAGTASRELFVNGVRADRDRGPRDPGGFTATDTGFTTSDPSYATWAHTPDVEVVRNNAWKQMRCPLSSITRSASGGSDLTVDPACWRNNHTAVPNPSFPFNGAGLPTLDNVTWIENSPQLLGTPGQFYLDSAAGQLYYVPRPGEDLATADVELPVTQELLDLAGTPGHLAPLNDTDPDATYTGAWTYSNGRHYGDLGADVHYTAVNGDAFSYTFSGTGLQVLSETNPDEGSADVYVDGTKVSTVSGAGSGSDRLAQQVLASVTGLAKGTHTVKLVKTGGDYLLIDGFTVVPDTVAPVHDITFSGVTFTYTTWNAPSSSGYVDNQAGVLWDPASRAPTRIPAAVQVHRGARIAFTGDTVTHTGTSGIDLADQTQDSTVSGSTITDLSGGGRGRRRGRRLLPDRQLPDDQRQHGLRERDPDPRAGVRRRGRHLGRPQPRHHARAQRRRLHPVLGHLARLGLGLGVELRAPGQAGAAGALPARHDVRGRQPHHRQPRAQRHGRNSSTAARSTRSAVSRCPRSSPATCSRSASTGAT